MITNSKGDEGFSCLKPWEVLNKAFGVPFTKIEKRISKKYNALSNYAISPQNRISSDRQKKKKEKNQLTSS